MARDARWPFLPLVIVRAVQGFFAVIILGTTGYVISVASWWYVSIHHTLNIPHLTQFQVGATRPRHRTLHAHLGCRHLRPILYGPPPPNRRSLRRNLPQSRRIRQQPLRQESRSRRPT